MTFDLPELRFRASRTCFCQQLSSTRRGARLARLLTVQQLANWGWAPDSELSLTAELVTAVLATNAVTHGRVGDRDFRLTLTLARGPALRIEVTDLRGEALPVLLAPEPLAERGRGLLLVDALASRWGTRPHHPRGKVVWVDLILDRASTTR